MIPTDESLGKVLLLASRPKTLLASISPVLVGVSLALRLNRSADLNFFLTSLAIVFCAMLIQVLSNFVNDLWDFHKGSDTTERVGPTRVVQSGLISPEKMQKAIIALTLIIIILGGALVAKGGALILFIGLISILGAYAYTAGPYPLAHNGLGELFVIIFFGPVPVFGTNYLLNGETSILAVLLGLPIGMIASGILQVNNIRDFKEDYKSGKRTLAVRYGLDFAFKLFNTSVSFSVLISLFTVIVYFSEKNAFSLLLFFIAGFYLTKKLKSLNSGDEFNRFLPMVALYLFLFSISLCTLILV